MRVFKNSKDNSDFSLIQTYNDACCQGAINLGDKVLYVYGNEEIVRFSIEHDNDDPLKMIKSFNTKGTINKIVAIHEKVFICQSEGHLHYI